MIVISDELEKKIIDSVNSLGFNLYYIDNEVINDKDHLIIYINKDNYDHSISIDDCVDVTREINKFIDDYIEGEYVLEISSSGVYRTLYTDEHLKEAIGDYVNIFLKRKIDGFKQKNLELLLEEVNEEYIIAGQKKIKRDNVKKINFIGRKND